MYYLLKVLLSAGMVVVVSEASKRNSILGGLFASLPLISFLGMIWLYVETGDVQKVSELSRSIFWLVLPSLPFFLLLPYLLGRNWGFYPSLATSTVVMISLYYGMLQFLKTWSGESP